MIRTTPSDQNHPCRSLPPSSNLIQNKHLIGVRPINVNPRAGTEQGVFYIPIACYLNELNSMRRMGYTDGTCSATG
jgi:hypothetical protein